MENAAYPEGCCAEANALGAMVLAGGRKVVAGAGGAQPITPCGGCRQKLREFATEETLVLAADPRGVRAQWTLGELLPASFGPAHLT